MGEARSDAYVTMIEASGTRRDGSPQQSMVGYTLDDQQRLRISTRLPSAKWRNIQRSP
jgi:hypothetical protein